MLVACVLLCAVGAMGFNVDIPSRVVYRGYNNSMFGFTVQAHVDGDQKMILVGAPEADSSYLTSLRRPGVVFRCAPGQRGYERGTPLDMCREMRFDQKPGNNEDKARHPIDQKSNQWFGATLSSTGRNGPIVACAPRYVSFVNAKLQHRDPVGSCFVAPSSNADPREINEYSPCRTPSHGQRKTGVCQAGFSAAISRDGQRLFMGAPGSWYWQGQVYSQSTSSRPVLIATPEASPKYDDQYMGYSMTVGDFAGQGEQGVAVAVPRGADLKGLVVLYTWELQNIRNITGSQIGAYFGYSLAAGDIDGDGTDDIIVGAPMFTKPKSDGFEHGRIYVIYQGRDRSFMKSHARTGEVSQGRFGLAVTSLGDINYDGFGDIAVGAPYGGENGRGVVYIYQGSDKGIREKYSQAITAEEISPTLRTFGFSLSGGVDLDNNNYTDLAVGAYKSDSVVFLKARPVVKVMAEVKFIGDTKVISLTDKRCTTQNGTRASCSDLMYCLRYDGINVDRQIEFQVSLDLDSRHTTTKRILTERGETVYSTNIMLLQGQQECKRLTVYLDEEIRDKLTPIEVKMTYNLVSQPAGNVVPPVLDQTQSISAADSLNIQKNCGPDNVCIPNLTMEASSNLNTDYVLGSGEYIVIDVKVANSGEDAFEAAYYLKIPAGVTYAKMERVNNADSVYCSISLKDVNGTSVLKCDLGNPLSLGEEVHFKVSLEVDATASNIKFYMESNSTNPEKPATTYDNSKYLTISVLVKDMLTIIGTSDPPELHYNASLYEASDADITDESKLGPQVIHKYNIKNEGHFTADETEFYIMWPYQTLTGENLMYMVVQPQTLGNVRCEVARHVNPDNLALQNEYAFLLTKEKQDMLSTEFRNSYAEYFKSNTGNWQEQKYYVDAQNIGPVGGQSSWREGGMTGGGYRESESRGIGGGYRESELRGVAGGGYRESESIGMTGGGYRESESRGGGFTREEQESIRRKLNAAAQAGILSNGAQQSGGGYQVSLNEGGLRPGYSVIREKNMTTVYDEHHNIVSQTETSTEYGSLAHEGRASSSHSNGGSGFQNSYSGQGSQNRQSWNAQGGYSAGSQNSYASGSQSSYASSQSGYAGGSSNVYAQGSQDYGSRGFVHSDLATTETVNRDIMKADSSRFRGGVTVVGDADDDITGFAANAARSPNNEFKYGIAQVGYDEQDQRRRDSTRRRRQAPVDAQVLLRLDECNQKYKCSAVRCSTGRLLRGQEVWVALRTRLNATVLNEISKDRAVLLSSLATGHVTRLSGVGLPERTLWDSGEAKTLVSPQLAAAEGGGVPLWVVVLAAVVGLLLLLLLIFALYKCGFFKRNRPSDHTERQPLNGRDEHL